jgi:hypothetical protein
MELAEIRKARTNKQFIELRKFISVGSYRVTLLLPLEDAGNAT